MQFEGGLARHGLRVEVEPKAVASADDEAFGWGDAVQFVVEERGDLPQVVADEQDRGEKLGGGESAYSTSSGEFELLGAGVFESFVEGFDGLPGVGLELFPFLALVGECLPLMELRRGQRRRRRRKSNG